METSLFNRLQATLLAVATVGLVLLAVLNFRQERQFQQPYDGVWWSEAPSGGGLIADKVLPNSPGERAGIQEHDLLTAVERRSHRPPVGPGAGTLSHRRLGQGRIHHHPRRHSAGHAVVVIPEPPDRSLQQALRVIGLIYLAIGIYVLFRRWTAPSRHPLLSLLPGFVRSVRPQVHRQAGSAGLDRLLVECGGRIAATRALSALCAQLP